MAGVDVGMGSAKDDGDFTPAEEASAFQTNVIMCCCQIGISAAQLGVSAYLLADYPIRNTVNIIVCACSIPLAIAGLVCLAHPEEAFAVPTMQVYSVFFILRAGLVTFDYAVLLKTRQRRDISHAHVVVATIVLALILILQLLNSLLVMAVIRIMRKRRNQRVARDSSAGEQGNKGAVDEHTPLLSS